MYRRVLIPNRGEIAVRIIKTCRELGVETVLAASTVDADSSLAARLAGRVIRIGGPRPAESYLNVAAILAAAKAADVDAVHPGYGFLSEDRRLAEACRELGVDFVGPPPEVLEKVGNKATARRIAEMAGVPVAPGRLLSSELSTDLLRVIESEIGYPVLIKAVHGGGGRGMRLVTSPAELAAAAAAAAAEASAAFGSGELYVEHFVPRARHVEVQVLGLDTGEILVLGDRDCSVQRRHQKLVEEAPAPTLNDELRKSLHDSARDIARSLGYRNAGTVEFVVDDATGEYFFLEVNARLQVEHPVTEAVTGIDIVRTQFEISCGGEVSPLVRDDPTSRGSAIECRINAECPEQDFRPSPGRLGMWRPPMSGCVRVDSHCYGGYVVSPYYDSLLAKVIAFGANRGEAIENMLEALDAFQVEGVDTTIGWQRALVASDQFATTTIHTRWVDDQSLMPAGG